MPSGWSYLTLRPLVASTETATIDAHDEWAQLAARVDATPESAEIRGMFPRDLLRTVPQLKSPRARYLPFSNYPMSEYLDLILRAAHYKYPTLTPANAILRLGLQIYSLFASSMVGNAIFSIANMNLQQMIERAPKAYEVTLKPGELRVTRSTPTEAHVELRNVWAFPDIFHAGIWLGGMGTCKARGFIHITRHSPCDVDFLVRWQNSDSPPSDG